MSTLTAPPRRTETAPASERAETRARAFEWLGLGLVALAAGLVTVTLLGPFGADAIQYHVSTTLLNQTIGLDAVSLLLVAPFALVVGILALRGHPAAPALALGPGIYAAYMFVQYIVGPEYLTRPGNSERFFPLYVALVALGTTIAVLAWNAFDATRMTLPSRRHLRLVAGVLLPIGAFVAFVRYVPALADAMSSTPAEGGYLAGPTFFWTIATLDLGLALPATIVACAGVLRGVAWGVKALYAVVGWFALVGAAVAGMGIAMYANDDPYASLGSVVTMALLGLGFVALATFVYRPLLRPADRGPRDGPA
jgi:hypothetical protein